MQLKFLEFYCHILEKHTTSETKVMKCPLKHQFIILWETAITFIWHNSFLLHFKSVLKVFVLIEKRRQQSELNMKINTSAKLKTNYATVSTCHREDTCRCVTLHTVTSPPVFLFNATQSLCFEIVLDYEVIHVLKMDVVLKELTNP